MYYIFKYTYIYICKLYRGSGGRKAVEGALTYVTGYPKSK